MNEWTAATGSSVFLEVYGWRNVRWTSQPGKAAESNTLLSSSPHRTLTTNTSPDNVCFTHETHSIVSKTNIFHIWTKNEYDVICQPEQRPPWLYWAVGYLVTTACLVNWHEWNVYIIAARFVAYAMLLASYSQPLGKPICLANDCKLPKCQVVRIQERQTGVRVVWNVLTEAVWPRGNSFIHITWARFHSLWLWYIGKLCFEMTHFVTHLLNRNWVRKPPVEMSSPLSNADH